MKKGKMVGAIALTAALAMGTMPAFASPTVSNDAASNQFSDNGSTTISAAVDTTNPQVKAQVPLKVVVVFGSTGASTIQAPSSENYKIENVGEGDIKVTDAELTKINTKFTLGPIYSMDGGTTYLDGNDNQITSGNYIMFTYQTTNNLTYLDETHSLNDAVNSARSDGAFVSGAKNYADDVITAGSSLGIQLGGQCYFTDTIDGTSDLTDALCTIKYTIASATA